jgi:hypothetical protein
MSDRSETIDSLSTKPEARQARQGKLLARIGSRFTVGDREAARTLLTIAVLTAVAAIVLTLLLRWVASFVPSVPWPALVGAAILAIFAFAIFVSLGELRSNWCTCLIVWAARATFIGLLCWVIWHVCVQLAAGLPPDLPYPLPRLGGALALALLAEAVAGISALHATARRM